MTLRNLGFYKELKYGDPQGVSIRERQPLPPDLKAKVVHYLEQGSVVAVSTSSAVDYFTGKNICRQTFCTDGEWLWYGELAHYVDRYDTVLDPDFLSTVELRGDPTLSTEELRDVEDAIFPTV